MGIVAGLLGCLFGVLGILTLGIIFVPLAALCAAIGCAGSGCLNSFPRMISGVPPGLVVGIADGRLRRREGEARPELQPTIGGGKFQAAAATGDGWK